MPKNRLTLSDYDPDAEIDNRSSGIGCDSASEVGRLTRGEIFCASELDESDRAELFFEIERDISRFGAHDDAKIQSLSDDTLFVQLFEDGNPCGVGLLSLWESLPIHGEAEPGTYVLGSTSVH